MQGTGTTRSRPGNRSLERETVDLSGFPDLVVLYLGMRVRRPRGIMRLLQTGREIQEWLGEPPDGLLVHEGLIFSLLPPHLGMREYWRDYDSLERWTRSEPHRTWWREFMADCGGTGFWHETYAVGSRAEAVYDGLGARIGLAAFAPVIPARGAMFGARGRANRERGAAPVISEDEHYRGRGSSSGP